MTTYEPPAGLVEELSSKVHEAWMVQKRLDGIESQPSALGFEQMVPYRDLPNHLQELDRVTVRACLAAVHEAGYRVVPAEEAGARTTASWASG